MKKALALVLALACVLSLSVVAFAAAGDPPAYNKAYDSDGAANGDVGSTGVTWAPPVAFSSNVSTNTLSLDPVRPAATVYMYLGTMGAVMGSTAIKTDDFTNSDFWKFSVDKDSNAKLVKKISLVDDKRLGDMARSAYLKIELNEMTATDENKTSGTIEFKAKADASTLTSSKKPATVGAAWAKDDKLIIDYTFWVSNIEVNNDDNPDAGDRVFMKPEANETNTLIWGDDRAALKFDADDDAHKFYARLSTSNMADVYAEYGDPVDADMWFYDFVNNPTIPATSKATLTLGIPWDDDEDYTPDPENCFLYVYDKTEGTMTDVTASFKYSEDEEEIPGWSIRTRQLGTYILSDTELDVTAAEPVESESSKVETPDTGKDIPNTGSSDMVNVALVAAVVSLAAAGAVAFRKVK